MCHEVWRVGGKETIQKSKYLGRELLPLSKLWFLRFIDSSKKKKHK